MQKKKIPKIILLIETSREYGRGLMVGISKYAKIHGPWSLFRYYPFDLIVSHRAKILSWIKKVHADGIILRAQFKIQEILDLGIPTITMSLKEDCPGTVSITTDEINVGETTAQYLLDLGFRNFAYFGYDEMLWSRRRCDNFCRKIRNSGYDVHVYRSPRKKQDRIWAQEEALVMEWISSLPKPVGLMACNDDRGIEILQACQLAGLSVPEEIAVIGVDNDELICELSDPTLTSVALNVEKAGYEAAEFMDCMLQGKPVDQQLIQVQATHIVPRESTDILNIQDDDVAEALSYIRLHAKNNIQVDDVVQFVRISRRGLYKKFQQTLGRSVFDEITRIRNEQITKMLLETNMNVSQIAQAMNFSGPEKLDRYFQRLNGMTPIAYRKKHKIQ
jgi:LacI family transcriptional regulator, galactose operon repressor